jgi:predicted nucleotidyltransferase
MLATTVARVNVVMMLRSNPPFRLAEISKASGLDHAIVRSALATLVGRGMVVRDDSREYPSYSPNVRSPYYQAALSTALVDLGLGDRLPAGSKALAIFVHGSVPAGQASPQSDLDVFVVGKIDTRATTAAYRPLEAMIGRTIDVTARTSAETQDALAADDVFFRRAIAGQRVWGEWS